MKTFKSSSLAVEFTGTRKDAMSKAMEYVAKLTNVESGNRFTFRADDESGFTVQYFGNNAAGIVSKWNAARDKWYNLDNG